MKRTFLASITALTLLTAVSCSPTPQKESANKQRYDSHPDWAVGATIYELNTRQITPEGTFTAATAELPRLKELGVDIIWLMPIQPIGVKERKGTLGSYYAISDYTGFNPEFGTRQDFEKFVTTAHKLGMKVILDWVANHTSPDHVWSANPDWHKRDSMGEFKVQYDWTDISELEYDNADMRAAMVEAMRFWADTIGVDGFRCDMAMLVPIDFWESTVDELKKNKPELFMLAEAEEDYLTEKAFNAFYGWDLHHTLNAMAQDKITADSLARQLAKTEAKFPSRAMRLNFTSNHDENSWAGSEYERMGEAAMQMAVLTYMLEGMPLIYTGQETGNTKRLQFFEKDTIERVTNAPQTELYKLLGALRKKHPALRYGAMEVLSSDKPKEVFAVRRTEGDDTVTAIFNFSGDAVEADVAGIGKHNLTPYGYVIID